MTPEATEQFRNFLRLRDLAHYDEAQLRYDALLNLARWIYVQSKSPGAASDNLLSLLSGDTSIGMGLLLHLATIDRSFFELAKRMAARTLVRHTPVEPLYLQMAAALLTAGPGPKSRRPMTARNCVIVLTVAMAQLTGLQPTQSREGNDKSLRSGCAKVSAALNMDYQTIEKIWRGQARIECLVAAGFSQDEASDFFRQIFPVIDA